MKKKAQSNKENQPRSSNKIERNMMGENVIDLILRDHEPLKDLIQILKDEETGRKEKTGALEEFVPLLTAHAKSEEQSLYVAMKNYKVLRMESFEGDTEHAIADQLMAEINATPDDDEWNAKVKVLAEMVEHHIEEEEGEILQDVRDVMDTQTLQAIGAEYTNLKTEFDMLYVMAPAMAQKIFNEKRAH